MKSPDVCSVILCTQSCCLFSDKNLNLMKKTFHSFIATYLPGLLACWLIVLFQGSLAGQCSPDVTPPEITCPPDQSVLVSAGQCSAAVTLPDAVATDNCSGTVSITSSMASGDLFPLGSTIVIYEATDVAGNTATCQMTVSLGGSIPRPICDRWITVPMDPSGTTTIYPEDILLYDDAYGCTQTGVSTDYGNSPILPSLSFTGTGTHEIYAAVFVAQGFWEKCWSFVSITGAGTESCTPDVTPPQIQCRPYQIVYSSTNDCQTMIDLDEPVVTDNCGTVTWTSDAPPDNVFTQGDWNITYTATDAAGNTGTCVSVLRFTYTELMLPVCHPVTVILDATGVATVSPDDVLVEGPYNCVNRGISLEFDIQADFLPFLTFTQSGVYYAQVYTTNFNGIVHGCQASITVNGTSQCNPDVLAPSVTPPPDITYTSTALAALGIDFGNIPAALPAIRAAFGAATHWDNCDGENSNLQESFMVSSDQILRSFVVTDASGNVNDDFTQTITILNDFTAHVPGWLLPGDEPDTMSAEGNLVLVAYSDQVFPSPCNNGLIKIIRTWSLADFGITPQFGLPATLPLLDTDNDGVKGDPYDIIAIGDSIWRYENHVPVQPLIKRTWSYQYEQIIRFTYPIEGTVFIDNQNNCAFDGNEPVLKNWKVKAIGQPSNVAYTALTDATGHYTLQTCPGDLAVEISLDVPFNYSGACPSIYMIELTGTSPQAQDIPVQLNADCDLLSVDIAPSSMRPCFGGYYSVNYYNYSQQAIGGTYVDVALDPSLQYTGSTSLAVSQGNNTYRFQTGDLQPGAFGQFRVFYVLDCDEPVGATHCSEASIYPVSSCAPQQAWSGADLRVTGVCEGDSVRLKITNVGTNPMSGQLNYVVTEDLIMARTMSYQLNQDASVDAVFHAGGATWRMETQQEPGHPWGGIVSATVEGCGGLNTPGVVNAFTVDDNDPFTATDCTQSTAAYDPNDKQGFPEGYDNQHFIEQNVDLEYRIRFQNTGTDTAFTVVLLDTLPQYLDAQSIRPGASSHDFDFDLLEGNILRFRFDNILLPDSNVNEAASHGFVQFRIAQQPDNPLGTVIHNSAAIYFDFNEPIITNETWHTLGEAFVEVVSTEDPRGIGPLRVYPNPAAEVVFFEMPSAKASRRFELTDSMGKPVRSGAFSEKVFRMERGVLPAGVYFFRISEGNGGVISGKVEVK